ncbi:YitT family protein [Balneola sp. MJW-20]|uniref:YitT family protein n=1 Tax=Gracilimonas aurantiaca TaxID=3234185 RepID=UPI0034651815
MSQTEKDPLTEGLIKKGIDPSVREHTLFEDLLSISVACLLLSFGIALFSHQQFLIGGTAGIAFLTQYASDWSFGMIFFLINIPFYALALWKLGSVFTFKTFVTVSLVSFMTDGIPVVFEFGEVNPIYAAALGGFMIGTGLLILFRHKTSLGGLNIMSIYLQKYHNISAGKFQMIVDVCIIVGAILIVDIMSVIYSVLAAIFLNLILAVNHRPGRYLVLD